LKPGGYAKFGAKIGVNRGGPGGRGGLGGLPGRPTGLWRVCKGSARNSLSTGLGPGRGGVAPGETLGGWAKKFGAPLKPEKGRAREGGGFRRLAARGPGGDH